MRQAADSQSVTAAPVFIAARSIACSKRSAVAVVLAAQCGHGANDGPVPVYRAK